MIDLDFITRYIQRLDDKGNNPTDSSKNMSKRIVNQQFNSSPSFSIVKVNGIDTDSIVNQDNEYDEKIIHFRADSIVNIGSTVEYKGKNYLLLSFVDSEIYPKGQLKLCNTYFPLPGEITRTQTGVNQFGEPIWSYTTSEPTLLPCIAQTTITSDNSDEAINLPEGQLQATIQFTEHAEIDEGKEFTMYGVQYQIIGIDRTKSINGVGLLVIKGKKV